jgi:hypothetical protein
MYCLAELNSLSATLDQRRLFTNTMVTISKAIVVAIRMTVEIVGLIALEVRFFLRICFDNRKAEQLWVGLILLSIAILGLDFTHFPLSFLPFVKKVMELSNRVPMGLGIRP